MLYSFACVSIYYSFVVSKKFYLFWLCWVFPAVSLFSGCGMRGLLWLWCVVSHCRDFSCCGHRLSGAQASAAAAPGFWSTASVEVVHGLSCSTECGIFLNQGSNPCLLHWQAFFTTEPPGNPCLWFFCFSLKSLLVYDFVNIHIFWYIFYFPPAIDLLFYSTVAGENTLYNFNLIKSVKICFVD